MLSLIIKKVWYIPLQHKKKKKKKKKKKTNNNDDNSESKQIEILKMS